MQPSSQMNPLQQVDRREFFAGVDAMLRGGQAVTFRAHGHSMWPLIHDGEVVVLTRRDIYSEGDIVLADTHEPYGVVLHRVVKSAGNDMWLQGDANCRQMEHCSTEDVAGAVIGVGVGRRKRDVASSSFVLRSRLWLMLGPLRRLPLALRNLGWRLCCSNRINHRNGEMPVK